MRRSSSGSAQHAARPRSGDAPAVDDAADIVDRLVEGALDAAGMDLSGLEALRQRAQELDVVLGLGEAVEQEHTGIARAAQLRHEHPSGLDLFQRDFDRIWIGKQRLAIGNARTSEADVALAWDVLREAAAAG